MELINSVSVGSGGSASIEFTSIPGTYTDLVVLISARHAVELQGIYLKFNGSSSTDYYRDFLQGTGSSAAVGSSGPATEMSDLSVINKSNATSNTFSNSEIFIPNYATTGPKVVIANGVSENDSTQAYQVLATGYRTTTDAITSIQLSLQSPYTFSQYSTAYLYGILKGSGGATVS